MAFYPTVNFLWRAKPAKILSRYPEIYRAGDFSVSSFQFLYQGTLRLAVITSIVYPHSSVCVGYCLLVASLRRCSPNKVTLTNSNTLPG
jgi:hypothetical protein